MGHKSMLATASACVLVLALCPAVIGRAMAASRAGAMGMGGQTVTATKIAGSYRITLKIGPMEQMYTQAQYKKMHPKHGEVMLSGVMAMGGMGMGKMNHHLEVHVLSRASGHVVDNAMVSISYAAKAGMSMAPTKVPVSKMMGIGMGMSDVHYGNNVSMAAGTYTVMVKVNATATSFTVKIA